MTPLESRLPEWVALQQGLRDAEDEGQSIPCQANPDPFFSDSKAIQALAAASCVSCPLLNRCGAFALANQEWYGVWGGENEWERWNRNSRGRPGAQKSA